MEELIKEMKEEMEQYVLKDKESGHVYDLIEVSIVIPIIEKYIKLAYDN